MRNEHRKFVPNSRSYGEIETETDHKLVKAEMNFQWYKIKIKSGKPQRKIDLKRFADKNKQREYHGEVRNNVNRIVKKDITSIMNTELENLKIWLHGNK